MKLTADDPKLTAYALGELNATDRAEVEAALAQSPAARREVDHIRQMAGALETALAAEPCPALNTHRNPAALAAPAASARATEGGWRAGCYHWLSWKPALALAGVAAVIFVLMVWQRPASSPTAVPSTRAQGQVTHPTMASAPTSRTPTAMPAVQALTNQVLAVQPPVIGPVPLPRTDQVVPGQSPAAPVAATTSAPPPSSPRPASEPIELAQATPPAVALLQAPLPIQLPMPTLKGTPDDLPKGPTIEPPPEKPPARFMAPAGITNLALGQPVTSSEQNPITGTLAMITDGEKEAFDDQVVELRKGTQWVQVDLGQPCRIYAIALWHDHRWMQLFRDVVVQLAEDPDFTQNIRTLYNNDHDNSSGLGVGTHKEYFETQYGRVVDAGGETARYVRLYTRGSNLSALNCWAEVEVYGLPPVVLPKPGSPSIGNEPQDAQQAVDPANPGPQPLPLEFPMPALK